MRARSALVALVGMVVFGVAGCGSSAKSGTATTTTGTASQCGSGTGLSETVMTAKYRMVLDVNPTEAMYTQAQVAAQHPKTGEVMLSGQMNGMPGSGSSSTTMMGSATTMGSSSSTPMGGMATKNTRHLEVHICSRSTGNVVKDAQPTITVVDHTAGGMTDHVSVAAMQGIDAGTADLHYGNNITMPAGRRYTVTVGLQSDTAVFNVTRPS